MSKIHIQAFDQLPPLLLNVAQKLKKETYQANNIVYSEEEKNKHDEKFCSGKDICKYVLAFDNEEIVGGLTLFKRTIIFENTNILLGGIGGVWVKKDKQKKGIGIHMLTKAMTILKDTFCDLAYIQVDTKEIGHFYNHCNFQFLPQPHTFTGKSGKKYVEENGMIAPLNSNVLFKKILHDTKSLDIGRGNW